MKQHALFRHLSLLLLLTLVLPGWAQQPTPMPPSNLVKQRYTDLKHQLNFLREIAKMFPEPRLGKLIQQIETHMGMAQRAYQLKKYRQANDEFSLVQKLINNAMRLVMEGPAIRLLEQVNEKIRLAEQALQRNFNPQVQKILENAKQSRNRALTFKNRNVQKMVEWLRLSLFQAENALKIMKPISSNVNLLDAFHEERSNYEDLFRRAQSMLQQNRIGLAQQLLNQAVAQRHKAESAVSRGNYQQAIESLRWASRLLWRVIDLSGASEANWQWRAREELQTTRELLRSVEQSTDLSRFPRLQKLFHQATKIYLDAENSFSHHNYPETLRKAELARRVLNRANRLLVRNSDALGFQFEQELQTLQNLLSQLEEESRAKENPEADQMLAMAQHYLALSRQANQTRHEFLARSYLFLATRFARGVRRAGRMEAPSQQSALAKFQAFQERYHRLAELHGSSPEPRIRIWLQLAREIFQNASEANANGRYRALIEEVRVGMQVLDRIEKRSG